MATAVLAAVALSACGAQRATTGAVGETTTDASTPVAVTPRASTPGATTAAAPTTPPSASAGSPYVEPGAGEGAPHYRENNGFRISGGMSTASAKDARREADRIEPVLRRLWRQGTWDPKTVRAALLKLGYREEGSASSGDSLGGTLRVEAMNSRFENGREVRPEGALVGLRVHDDACVTAFVQKTNYQVSTNGPYPETGCFEPPAGH